MHNAARSTALILPAKTHDFDGKKAVVKRVEAPFSARIQTNSNHWPSPGGWAAFELRTLHSSGNSCLRGPQKSNAGPVISTTYRDGHGTHLGSIE